MSDKKNGRPDVPEGVMPYVTTTQMDATEAGFVGYKTTWKEFQKEVEYQTPKRP